MIKNKITLVILLSGIFGIMSLSSCKHEDTIADIDQQLYDMAKSTDGFTWYKNSSAPLEKSAGSGHAYPFLKTRYNSTASSQLDSIGKIMSDASFPEGSLVVKELLNSSNGIERYAILYKDSGNSSADANGWVWGYINADGSVAVSATEKGSSCISCHSQTGSIDYMLMNAYFP